MAVATFEEVLAAAVTKATANLRLSAEEKKLFENTLASDPGLKEGWLRQDDYSRKSTQLADDRKKHEAEIEHAARMKAWADDAVPKYDKLVEVGIIDKDGNEMWSAQKAQLEKDLADAKALGGDVDSAELEKRVKEIVKQAGGDLTKQEIQALYASEGRKMAQEVFDENWGKKEKDFNEKTIPFVGGFSASIAVVANHYEQETGKKWDKEARDKLYALMSATNKFDAMELEDELLKEHRAKKAEDQRVEERAKELLKERGISHMPEGGNENFIPQDGQKGALQMALEKSGEGDFESMIKSQSVKAAKELHQEGKG